MPGVGPGDHLNRFGWLVLGTTIGGNAIVGREDDRAVYFAGHTWYHDDGVHYQKLAGDRSWVSLPLTEEGIRTSLFKLADSPTEFLARAQSGGIDRTLDAID